MEKAVEVKVDINLLTIDRKDIYRAMGYKGAIPDEITLALTEELLEKAFEIAKPRYCYKIFECTLEKDSFTLESITFNCQRTIGAMVRNSETMALFVATAGEEFQSYFDEVSNSGDILNLFVLDAIGTVIVEATGDYMEAQLQKEIESKKHTNRFSPGYCAWDINEQHKLFSLFPSQICGITLGSTSLMHPIKSISGVVGIGDKVITKKYGCEICKRTDCNQRISGAIHNA
ncbi:MAG: vitamin B12 dependent-methionine synthase activation domain-containing protein [Rikenellaceae bacterium]